MRIIGMDIHRSFAQVAILAEGQIQQELRVELTNERFLTFARSLEKADVVVIEATGNSAAVEKLLRPFVTKVAIANPRLVRAIAFARVKTDKTDAGILARLYAIASTDVDAIRSMGSRRRRRLVQPTPGTLHKSTVNRYLERRAQNVKQYGALSFDLSSRFTRQIDSDLTRSALSAWVDDARVPRAPTTVRFQARLSNELWQFDISP